MSRAGHTESPDHVTMQQVGAEAADAVTGLYLRGFDDTLASRLGRIGRWWCRRRWLDRLRHPGSACVIAKDDGIPVGFAYGFRGCPRPRHISALPIREAIPVIVAIMLRPSAMRRAWERVRSGYRRRRRRARTWHRPRSLDALAPAGNRFWMEPITVDSHARGKRIGPRLFDALCRTEAARQCETIGWAVAVHNAPMLTLSRRVGGQIIKRGEHEWYFRSDLARRVGRQLSGVRSDPREIEIETVTGPRAVRAIMTEWQRLFESTPSAPPHLSPAWYQAWMAEADAASTPLVVMGRRGVEPAAVLALSVRNTFGVRAASFPGASRPGYQGILGDGEPRLCDRMARHIAQAPDFDVLVLENLSTIDRCTNNLLDSLVEYGFVRDIVPRNVCHRIELPVSFDEYFRRQRSSKSRNSLSRKARRLRTNHNVDIVRFESDELDEELIERTADVQRASWMARRGADDFSDPFYRQLVHRLGQAGLMRLWLMRIDDHDAAFVLASVHGETLIYEWTAFRLEYRDLSVGQILTAQVIRDACESGLRYFDFLHGDADYKRYWANDRHDVARVALGCGARGRLVTQALATTWRLRRNRHLRAGYRRLRNALRSDGLDGTRSEAA